MSFSADWLALRASADARSRDPGLAARLAAQFAGQSGVRVLEVGAGTGALMAVTAPLLGPGQRWRLVDADAGLLSRVVPPAGVAVETVVADLAEDMEALFDPAPGLLACSAFLDLCGADWLDRLAGHAAASGAAVYAVLSYDGREEWSPPDPLDAAVLSAFHADQRRDKGLGRALGPDAAAHLAGVLAAYGYEVMTAPSDWRLSPPGDASLIAALAAGTGAAVAPALAGARDWAARRAGAEAVTIGHVDLLALPPRRG